MSDQYSYKLIKSKQNIIYIMQQIEKTEMTFHDFPISGANSKAYLTKIIQQLHQIESHCPSEQFYQFLEYFVNEEPAVILELVQKLREIVHLLDFSQVKFYLLPLLGKFCQLDEEELGFQSVKLIVQIAKNDSKLLVSFIQKMMNVQMLVTKKCVILLILSFLERFKDQQTDILKLFLSIIESPEPAFRIAAYKYLQPIVEMVNDHEIIYKIIETAFKDEEELAKLLCIKPLTTLYPFRPVFVLGKIKMLFSLHKWRSDIALCENSQNFSKTFKKFHFKQTIEPQFLRLLHSEQNDIRAASCQTLPALAHHMTHSEAYDKLYLILCALSKDKDSIIRVQLSKVVAKMLVEMPKQKIKEIIQIIMQLLQNDDQQVWQSILKDLTIFHEELSPDVMQFILQEQTDDRDWRVHIIRLKVVQKLIISPNKSNYYNEQILELLKNKVKSRIESVQRIAVELIVKICREDQKLQRSFLLPYINQLGACTNYRVRQQAIHIINLLYGETNQKIKHEMDGILENFLKDKVPNMRYLALLSIKVNFCPLGKSLLLQIQELKQDTDFQVRLTAENFRK